MALANFEDLCDSLCELVGVQPPQLEADEHGTIAFTLTCQGLDIGFVMDETGGAPGAVIVTPFGAPDKANELQVLRDLLDTNFLVSGLCAPVLVRNPATGHIALHQSCLLSHVDAQDVYQLVINSIDAAMRWADGSFFGSSRTDGLAHESRGGASALA